MKICITSKGQDLSAPVDPRFGRARFFVVYDDQTKAFEAVDNALNMDAASGAGVQSATRVAGQSVDWVVSGHIGPKAMSVLQASGVKVAVGAEGSVADAIRAFEEGRLEQADEADRRPHW